MQFGGYEYSRDDIIKTFDELIETSELDMHLYIYSNPALLEFLENEQSQVPDNLFNNAGPEQEFSALNGHVAEAFRERIKKTISKRDFLAAMNLYSHLPLWKYFDPTVVNETIHHQLRVLTEEMEELSENEAEKAPEKFSFLYKLDLANFLNRLSRDLEGAIDSLVSSIINLLVRYSRQSDINRNYLYKSSVMLTNVKCRQDLMDLIRRNHRVFSVRWVTGSGSKGSDASSSGSSSWVFYVTVSIIIAVIRIAGTCDNHSSSRYRYNTPTRFSYSEPSNPHSDISSLKFYRSWQNSVHTFSLTNTHSIVPISEILSGQSPFKTCFKTNPLYLAESDSLQKVLIENNSGYDLIVFTFNNTRVWSNYFFNTVPDTLYFYPGYRLCFYFGEKLAAPTGGNSLGNIDINSIFGPVYSENYFEKSSKECLDILKKDYTLEKENWFIPQKKARSKKKNNIPVIEFTPQFFKADSIIKKQIKLRPLQPDSIKQVEDMLDKSVEVRSKD